MFRCFHVAMEGIQLACLGVWSFREASLSCTPEVRLLYDEDEVRD